MKNKKTIKNILIALVVAIVLLVVYSMLTSKNNASGNISGLSSRIGAMSVGQIKETDTVVANAEILKILGSIENIELRDDIFINPIFRKLVDKSFSISRPGKIGRSNPFLPIGYDNIANNKKEKQNDIVLNFNNSQEEDLSFFDLVNNENTDIDQEVNN